MLKNFFLIRYRAFREVLACLGMGLRDIRHDGLWWRSALCSTAAVGLWFGLYYHFGTFFLQVSGVISLVSVAGLMGLGVLDFGPGMASAPASLSHMGSLHGLGGLAQSLMSIAQVALVALALASVVYVLVFVAGVLGTLQLPARWQLLPRAQRVVARRYPRWQPTVPVRRAPMTAWDLGRRILGLLALFVPVWSMFVLLRLLITFNMHWMYGPAAEGVVADQQRRDLATAQRSAIFMLGVLLFMAMVVPVLNLLVPALLCTSICHLQRRGWTGQTGSNAATEDGLVPQPRP
ncbi:hypothetical protein SAMN05428959_103616 [Duganella sp. CF517]|uniref:hypothetical protein n=1 Tax=Duganella sp. CF517 TaxID=1881038 RepID=UPI0008D6BFA5|nr:hypothetical protein [Duganella sp. CF517]SEN88880.1 hypothetical protein SAMN05428959_103616 [Duganella sp. CF517]